MHGTDVRAVAVPQTRGGEFAGTEDLHPLAQRLTREFQAPVGLLDPAGGTWVARLGNEPEAFPQAGPALLSALAASGVSSNRALVWRPDRDRDHEQGHDDPGEAVWLVLPVARVRAQTQAQVEGTHLLALVGFAGSPRVASAPGNIWGPSCPEPALRAWGQSLADQLRIEAAPRDVETDPALRAEGSEQLLIARLIRRLRISDAPERFQSLATNALRGALNVAAVAWIPGHLQEPVTFSGQVDGLHGNAYRALVATPQQGPVQVVNRVVGGAGTGLTRYVAVAADSQGSAGWLVAVNTLDDRAFAMPEIEVLQPVASLIATQQTNARLYSDLKELLFGVIRALTAAIDAKDPYTSGHSERVARIAVRLAEALGVPAHQRSDLYLMGLLHDVGKIGVDDAVLKKTGPLTAEEYRAIQSHVEIGVHILTDLKKLNHLLPGVRHHHESLDGTGYPCGLAGDKIPFEARLLAVADSFDAMSSTRPYRRRLTPSQIDEILHKGAGVQWDPKIIDALFACRLDIELIRQKGLGESLQVVVNETLGRS